MTSFNWGIRYPALRLALAIVVCILIVIWSGLDRIRTPFVSICLSVVLLTIIVLYRFRIPLPTRQVLTVVLVFIVVWLRYDSSHLNENDVSIYAGLSRPVRIHATVDSEPIENDKSWRYVVQVDSIWISRHLGFSSAGKIAVTSTIDGASFGQRILLTGLLRKPRASKNPGEFDFARYLAAEGIGSALTVTEAWQQQSGTIERQPDVFQRLRYYLYAVNKKYLSAKEASIVNAMMLGIRHDIPDDVRKAFSTTGTVHVLALSGLHTAFIIAMIFGVLSLLRIPYRARLVLGITGLWLYVALVGFLPSVTRAAVMATIVLAGMLFQKRSNVINSLFAALSLILIVDPADLFDLGLQLSFLAVLAIVALYPRIEGLCVRVIPSIQSWRGLPRKAFQLLLVSVAAQAGTVPLTMYYFNTLPVTSIVANVVVVPASGFILGLGGLTQLGDLFSPSLARWYANVNEWVVWGMVTTVEAAQRLPLAFLEVWTFGTAHLLICYAAIGVVLLWSWRVVRRMAARSILIVICVGVWVHAFERPRLVVTFLDVGQGDGCVVQFEDGRTLVVDAGDSKENWDVGERVVAPFLRRQGISKIDFFVLSHPHDDHVGGAGALLEQFEIGQIWHSGQWYASSAVRRIDSVSAARGIPSKAVRSGDFFAIDGRTRLYFLHPDAGFVNADGKAPRGTNNASVVMMMEYDRTRWLFTGDAEVEALARIQTFGPLLDADVVKISHHGSWNGTTTGWIDAVSPIYAVISCGEQNLFNHPSAATLAILERSGAEICRTDRSGAVQFRSDGFSIERLR